MPEADARTTSARLDELSIVIVTWRSAADVEPLLVTIRGVLDVGTELVVVENGSGDSTPALVRAAAPSAVLLVNPTNRGFAAAANQGWRESRGRYVLFLNPDTLADTAGLQRALCFLAADSTIGILGCRTVNPDGTPQPTVDRFHDVSRLIGEALRGERDRDLPRGESPATTRDVDWVYGSFLLCRREALEAVGGFDESYEMYGEDIDLCDRAHAAGWRVVYFAETTIVHRGNRSGALRYGARRDIEVLKGTLRYFRRRRGRWHERAFRAAAGARFAVRALASVLPTGDGAPDRAERARRYARMAWLCATGDRASRGERHDRIQRVARQELS